MTKQFLPPLRIVDHRNLTVHTYNEELALEVFQQLLNYLNLIEKWLKQIVQRF
ncbi:hypothetical protein JCM21714_3787 [Gracilibacillus boraciitolerans JCM 21714]|uniref:Nucleotidyltransferase n=1 Tax=Gracilibacillus boraciitolerans JCM 21714 TaxID=1298598 RepID=W4VN45_9BACI|nr:nucleotidyltransferase substrate binding protein [Gracilibacillus boraciitolerans]GAE94612.1 hypothetical protein JCM21714_3787 [Gracilibacillus boraciitolerans JCM 21714]